MWISWTLTVSLPSRSFAASISSRAAALLEAGGDALIRKGLHSSASLRTVFMTARAVLLFAYG